MTVFHDWLPALFAVWTIPDFCGGSCFYQSALSMLSVVLHIALPSSLLPVSFLFCSCLSASTVRCRSRRSYALLHFQRCCRDAKPRAFSRLTDFLFRAKRRSFPEERASDIPVSPRKHGPLASWTLRPCTSGEDR